jgi:hypothetical protein
MSLEEFCTSKSKTDISRRRMVHLFSECFLVDLFSGVAKISIIKNPLPHDAKMVGFSWESQTGQIRALIESESYPETKEGMPFPYAEPIWVKRETC